jgi:DNA mismatch repair protein MLH3
MADELQDLVRTYLAEIDEVGSTFALPPVVPAAAGEVVWQKALRWCPRALVNLVNSRACRGECSPLRRLVGT